MQALLWQQRQRRSAMMASSPTNATDNISAAAVAMTTDCISAIATNPTVTMGTDCFPVTMETSPMAATIATTDVAMEQFFYPGARELRAFHDWYIHVHGYLATVVCVFGIVANLLNIVVLTRRNMISPTNCILTALALSDGLTMLAYLPFALRFYVLYGTDVSPERNSLEAIRFMLFYACFSVVVHTVSIWLTVTLAIFRYVFIRHPRHGSIWCSLRRAKLAVFIVNVVTIIVCIPNFVTIRVQGRSDLDDDNHHDETDPNYLHQHLHTNHSSGNHSIRNHSSGHYTMGNHSSPLIWIVEFKEDSDRDILVKNLNFWIQALLVKLVPCVGLTILSLLLVRTMKVAEQRRLKLRCNNPSNANTHTGSREETSSRDRKTNRTTRMLLVVVVLFLITEFPQGIINLLSGIATTNFVLEVYMTLGDLLDILALINNGINFILYCTMSKQFRDTFFCVFLPCGARTAFRGGASGGGRVTTTTTATRTTVE